jgi:hypothetical protein
MQHLTVALDLGLKIKSWVEILKPQAELSVVCFLLRRFPLVSLSF